MEIQEPNYTENAWLQIDKVFQNPDFARMDDSLIYDTLQHNLRAVPFCDYLKRYLHRSAGLESRFDETEDKLYRRILCDSFRDNLTPASFSEDSTTSLRQAAANWLSQKVTRRQTVLLLGFGLRLSPEEVNLFLTKALRLQSLDLQDPFELCCAYCYEHNYAYPKFEELMRLYGESRTSRPPRRKPVSLSGIDSDQTLLREMEKLRSRAGESYQQTEARRAFRRLYHECCETIADIYNNDITGSRVYSADDIGPADLERIISSAIPQSPSGNLITARDSSLGELFRGLFLNRQRISELLADRVPVRRFELLTLLFFLHSENRRYQNDDNPRARLEHFLQEGNELLRSCYFGEIYPANPYEAFLLMCMLSDEPMSTYADVWEKAYN